ncbi:MAG: hypothetical protein ACYCVZ_02540 [Streptosporangiaceae bacterium]
MIEIASAVLLSLATVLAAWSAFQSAKWSGVQAIRFSRAMALRTESVRASTLAGQQTQIEEDLFSQWVNAYAAGHTRLANFYFDRFSPGFRPAVRAWLATDPLHNPAAPASPFSMPQYRLAATVAANHLRQAAEERTAAALSANQYSDDYVLLTVLFASTLLFAGLAPKFTATVVQSAMSGLALILLIAGAAFLIAFPRRY